MSIVHGTRCLTACCGNRGPLRRQRGHLDGQRGREASHPTIRGSVSAFLGMLRAQRQRLFFTLPPAREGEYELWDLTLFRYGGLYLEVAQSLSTSKALPRRVMPLLVRGLNRVFTGMLIQNQDELVLATSGSHSQSKTSPLLDAAKRKITSNPGRRIWRRTALPARGPRQTSCGCSCTPAPTGSCGACASPCRKNQCGASPSSTPCACASSRSPRASSR
jgi:hypothetical protein